MHEIPTIPSVPEEGLRKEKEQQEVIIPDVFGLKINEKKGDVYKQDIEYEITESFLRSLEKNPNYDQKMLTYLAHFDVAKFINQKLNNNDDREALFATNSWPYIQLLVRKNIAELWDITKAGGKVEGRKGKEINGSN